MTDVPVFLMSTIVCERIAEFASPSTRLHPLTSELVAINPAVAAATFGDLRLPGIHPLLAPFTDRQVGDLPFDSTRPLSSDAEERDGVVPDPPTPRRPHSARGPEPETSRALRIFRHRRKLRRAQNVPVQGDPLMVASAGQSFPALASELGTHGPAAEAVSASVVGSQAPSPPTGSEAVTRRAGCGNSARPDL